MPRQPRRSIGGLVYHVLNRANGRRTLFHHEQDYLALFRVLEEARQRFPRVQVFALCVMPNHWHLVVRPGRDGELSLFMRWLTQTHTQRWRHAHHTVGEGALYQGRFKSFIVQEDEHFLVLCRYVERNPLRCRRPLARRAQDWRWSSAGIRSSGEKWMRELLDAWPVDRPRNWTALLNEPQDERQEKSVAVSIERNRPLGDEPWTQRMVRRLHLEHTMRNPGRPRVRQEAESKKRTATP